MYPHLTAIEGNTLVLKQVEALLAEGRAVGNKELREYLEVRGHADAASWVYSQALAVLDNLYKFVLPAVAGPAPLVALAALASDQMSVGALRVAAVRGALQATKGPDGQWRSSRNWVDAYLANRRRRRS